MPTREIGVGPFIRLYQMEEKARNMYAEYELKVKNAEMKELFDFIKLQEEGHMRIAQKIIEMVQ